jgi:integrase/recombinase XerD
LLITAHINHLVIAGYRPRTVQERRSVLHAFTQHAAPATLDTATRLHVESFLARPLAAESRRTYRSHLRAFYKWATDEGYIATDPTAKVPPVRVPRGTPRPISEDELHAALDRANARTRCWLLLMALGGLRCLEVAGLRPADVLHSEHGALLYLRETKGGGSATVPAHPEILTALAVLPVSGDGLWWDCGPRHVSVLVGKHLRGSGVDATAHQLRHLAGTMWIRASGHDLLTTSRLLRHATVQSTQVYAALDVGRPAAVINAVQLQRPVLN